MCVSTSMRLADLDSVLLKPGFACSRQVGVLIPSEACSTWSMDCTTAVHRGGGSERYMLRELTSFPFSFSPKCHSSVLAAGKEASSPCLLLPSASALPQLEEESPGASSDDVWGLDEKERCFWWLLPCSRGVWQPSHPCPMAKTQGKSEGKTITCSALPEKEYCLLKSPITHPLP